jgi:hypothetical protein
MDTPVRIARNTYAVYLLLMTTGMAVTSLIYHDVYPSYTMIKVLLPVEVLLTLMCAGVVWRYYHAGAAMFGKLHSPSLGWLAPLYLMLIAAWGTIIVAMQSTPIDNAQWSAFMITGFATGLVGISEELMFRGIILQSLLKTQSAQRAVLISALAFASLHSINIIAHHSWLLMLGQLAITFVFGVFAASVTIRMKNLIPMIAFHWLWDFQTLSVVALPVHTPEWVAGTIVIELILGIVLWVGLKNYKPASA